MISAGKTTVAYLPTKFEIQGIGNENQSSLCFQTNPFSKVEALKDLHECVEHCSKPSYQVSTSGFSVATKFREKLRLHFLLTSYVANLPKAEYLLAIKRGSQTFMSCHICTISKDDFPN